MDASTLTGISRTQPNVAPDYADSLDFLRPNPKFEQVLRSARETKSRIWLFFQAAHLEAFARTAPFRGSEQ
jgi:hypothetical protein